MNRHNPFSIHATADVFSTEYFLFFPKKLFSEFFVQFSFRPGWICISYCKPSPQALCKSFAYVFTTWLLMPPFTPSTSNRSVFNGWVICHCQAVWNLVLFLPMYYPTLATSCTLCFSWFPSAPVGRPFSSLWGATALLAQASAHQPTWLHNTIWETPLLLLQLV